jgi:hypothetical protein
MVDEDTPVPSKKNWIDPCEKDSTQDTVEFFWRLVFAEITECWAPIDATFKYQECRVYAATKKYRTRGIRVSSDL